MERTFVSLLLIMLLLFVVFTNNTSADFNHGNNTPSNLDYNSQPSNSCYRKEIDALRVAIATNLQSTQDLERGRAELYDRLAELGQTCP